MKEDLGGEEGIVFIEATIVKDKEELDPIVQCLDWMRDSSRNKLVNVWALDSRGFWDLRWEEPDISRSKVIDKSLAILVHSLRSWLIHII